MKNVAIIIGKCTNTNKIFGIRTEENSSRVWSMTWAFKISTKTAKNEGYENTHINGKLVSDSEYNGCPFCKNMSIVKCGACGKISCWASEGNFRCSHCANSGTVDGCIDNFFINDDY